MQDGDLELWTRPRYVVVLEGVLCAARPIEQKGRFRKSATRITGYHINWHEVPLKRLVYLKEQWPDTAQDIVTFISQEFLDDAIEFLDAARIQYDNVGYQSFNRFCATLRFQPDIKGIYDSDQGRLNQYGQLGVAVQRGFDF